MEEETDTAIDKKTRDELKAVMREISLELHKVETSRDQIKEIIDAASKTFNINKALIRKVARFYHKKNISTYENEAYEIKHLYTQLTAPTQP